VSPKAVPLQRLLTVKIFQLPALTWFTVRRISCNWTLFLHSRTFNSQINWISISSQPRLQSSNELPTNWLTHSSSFLSLSPSFYYHLLLFHSFYLSTLFLFPSFLPQLHVKKVPSTLFSIPPFFISFPSHILLSLPLVCPSYRHSSLCIQMSQLLYL
jgi:hypothetical protein